MIKVLEQAIDKIRRLPEERQAAAAEALELIAAQAESAQLSAEELDGVRSAQEAVPRGELASEDKVREFFDRYRA